MRRRAWAASSVRAAGSAGAGLAVLGLVLLAAAVAAAFRTLWLNGK